MSVALGRGGVGVGRCVSTTAASGTSHPRARLGCALLVPKVAPALPSGAGRLLRSFRLAVDVCFALPTDTPRDGGDAGGLCHPKPSAALFRLSKLAEKLHPCQSIASRLAIAGGICARFSAFGGRRPLHNERRTLCARSTGDLPRNSARAGFAYSRAFGVTGEAATGTANAGRENRSPRWWGR